MFQSDENSRSSLDSIFSSATGTPPAATSVRSTRSCSSIVRIRTVTSSPTCITSSARRTYPSPICEIWTSPSLPGKISTNAPNGAVRTTLPVYSLPISGIAVIARIFSSARLTSSALVAAISTVPSSSILMVVLVSSWMPCTVLPRGPMRSLIFCCAIWSE